MKKLFLFFAALCCSLMTFGGQVFHSLISVEDNSVADWDAVPPASVFTAVSAANPVKSALKTVRVYADAMYINIYVTWDEEQITDKEWVPFHIFLDADNSDATGGYGDEFTDPNAEWMLEGGIISGGAAGAYDPAVFKWWGEVGGNGWEWVDPDTWHTDADFWGAIIGEGQGGIGACQLIGNNGAEIQLLREAATCITWNATTFGIGFDIQQNWSSVGVLPNADADEVGSEVLAAKMKVTIDNEGYENYDIIEGDLSYRTLSESTVSVSSCDPDARVVTIPSSIVVDGVTYLVTTIGYRAFEGCTNLSSVTIPNSVTTIGASAFAGCTGLTSIIIPKSVTTIEEKAFYGCYGLKTVFNVSGLPISKGSTSYGYVAYYADNVYEGTPVGDFIFANETILVKYLGNGSSVTIPDFVTQIEKGAFDGCSGLTSIVWNAKNCSLSSYNTLNSISNQITSFIFGNEVEVIPSYLCSGMTKLTSITIPYSVTTIGDWAFEDCTGLTSVTIPVSVTSIGTGAFVRCESLTELAILNPDVVIGSEAFSSCMNLTIITAPASFFDVPDFYWYSYSKQFASVVVNGGELNENELLYINRSYKTLKTLDVSAVSNTEFADEAFKGYYNLESLVLPQSLERIGYMMVAGCKNLKSIDIPASVVEIDQSAFEDCRSIKTITFNGNQLKTIGNWAFYNAHQLQNLTLPEGIEEIGEGAFYGCVYLEDLVLPRSIKSIGDNGFSLCSKLNKITVHSVTPPTIEAKTFYEVNRQIPVYVPKEAVADYKQANYWKEFNIIGVETPTNLESMHGSQSTTHKVLCNGQLLIEANNATYTLMGQKVR